MCAILVIKIINNVLKSPCDDLHLSHSNSLRNIIVQYEYFHQSTTDRIFVSSSSINDVSEYTVCEETMNLEDQLCVALIRALLLTNLNRNTCKTSVTGMRRWDKADLNFYARDVVSAV